MASRCRIIADRLRVTFPGDQLALEDVSFESEAGSFVAIVGPSGCGKSTLLRCIGGLQLPTHGLLRLEPPADRARVAFVFQDPTLLPWRSVDQNVALPLELRGVNDEQQKQQTDAAINRVGLSMADASKLPHMLSGGMRMRVSFARAMVTMPEVLLMDEPFAALDDISRQQLNDELLRWWIDQGWTTLFVTHNVAEAVFLSQRILVMSANPGRIAADISVDFDYPRTASLRSTGEFGRLVGQVGQSLRGASE